ncbi:ATP-binding cassette sub- G member 2 [Globomyces sp. JEL0801]|nr:ATP-binding cassette sub- G member 2 [Globomyces sp. JEL0801]
MSKDETIISIANQPTSFVWSNVNYSVPVNKQSKQLLKDVSGQVKAGEVIAIMGGSGAGKSTLLNTLAGRIGPGELSGNILVDGKPRNPSTWTRQCAYVEQDDILFKNLTVFETLMYSARLRLSRSIPITEKKALVDKVIAQLGLEGCRNTRIGDEMNRGISGGERKRVSIGVELVTDPNILFLDEPTSGLDAFNAFNAMESIQKMAKETNKIVLMTIHQPRTDILNLFDKIILLSAGQCLWFGPIDDAIKHFDSLGYSLPPKTNPTDYFLDIITPDQRSEELKKSSLERIKKFSKEFKAIESKSSIEKPSSINGSLLDLVKVDWPSSWIMEFFTLLNRNMINVFRDKMIIGAALGQAFFVALIICMLYWQVTNDIGGVQNRVGVFFFLAINLTFSVVMPSINEFPDTKKQIKRERAAGSYRPSSAFLAKVVSTWPLIIIGNTLMAIPVYWLVGLSATVQQFFTYMLIVYVHVFTANNFGLMIGSAVPSAQVGLIVTPLFLLIFMLFGGLLLNIDKIPSFLRWLQYTSMITYTNKALAQNEFSETLKFTCEPGQPCYSSGPDVVKAYSLNTPSLWECIGINASMGLLFMIIGLVMFSRTSRPLLRLK